MQDNAYQIVGRKHGKTKNTFPKQFPIYGQFMVFVVLNIWANSQKRASSENLFERFEICPHYVELPTYIYEGFRKKIQITGQWYLELDLEDILVNWMKKYIKYI